MAVVVVTGGTRGIGLGLARELVARGSQVVVCGRSAPAGLDAGITAVVCDVTDRAAVAGLWDAAVAEHGRVDHWINNAGVSTVRAALQDVPPAQLDAVATINLLGVLHGSAVAVAGMRAQGFGTVWNMEGLGSDGRSVPGLAAYGATKRAVTYLTGALARELRGSPVRAAHLSPGMVVTELLIGDYPPEELAQAKKIFNVLADRVETVTPWLADKILAGTGNGGRVAWLTRRRAAARFALAPFRKRDLFGDTP